MSLTTGLAAFYKLADANDSVGSRNLTETGSPAYAAGKIGNALSLDGTNRLLLTDDLFRLDQGGDRTFAGWIKAVDFTGQPGILSNWANGGGGPVQWLFWHDGTNLAVQIRDVSNTDHAAQWGGTINADTFYFFCLRWTAATGKFSLSIDTGTAVEATTPDVKVGIGSFELGGRNNGGANFKGLIDAVGVWSRVLSSAELTSLYNAGAGREIPFPADAILFPVCLYDDSSAQ